MVSLGTGSSMRMNPSPRVAPGDGPCLFPSLTQAVQGGDEVRAQDLSTGSSPDARLQTHS